MNNLSALKNSAINATTLSHLMTGREKISTDELTGKTLTPIAVDVAIVDGKKFPVFLFAEDDEHYYNGGMILGKIVDAWLADYDGDIDALSDDLGKNSGEIRFRFRSGKTKDGARNLTTVDII